MMVKSQKAQEVFILECLHGNIAWLYVLLDLVFNSSEAMWRDWKANEILFASFSILSSVSPMQQAVCCTIISERHVCTLNKSTMHEVILMKKHGWYNLRIMQRNALSHSMIRRAIQAMCVRRQVAESLIRGSFQGE